MLPTNRPPTHPGEMLLKEFLVPMKISQKEFAQHLGWPYARLSEIIHGRRGVTAASALALGESLKIEPEFWLNLQKNWDLWHAKKKHTCIKQFVIPEQLSVAYRKVSATNFSRTSNFSHELIATQNSLRAAKPRA